MLCKRHSGWGYSGIGAVDKLLLIAETEIGYLEKKSNSQLDDKTANAGSNNYTKYARDLYPDLREPQYRTEVIIICILPDISERLNHRNPCIGFKRYHISDHCRYNS